MLVHTWNSSPLWSNLLRLQCTCTVSTTSGRPYGGPLVLCERVNDLRHSLFHPLNYLIMTASELRELAKITGTNVWTIARLRKCLDAYLSQIVCDKDGIVDWCIVLVEMPLTRFEECWPLPTESLPELPWNLNIVTLTLTLWPVNSGILTSLLLPHPSSSLTDSLPFLNLLCHSKTDARFMQDGQKAVWSIPSGGVGKYDNVAVQNISHYSTGTNHSKWSQCLFWSQVHQAQSAGGVEYTKYISAERSGPTSVLDMILNNLMLRFQQCWSFGGCRVLLHYHCSLVHSGLKW